eukprot:gene7892-8088_t
MSSLAAPGFYYQRISATLVKALPCPEDTYSKGFDKSPNCTPCPPGFKTDPQNDVGTHTSADVCVAPPGYFLSGSSLVLCPKGEYQDQFGFVTSCKSCSELFGPEPGFMLLDSGGRGVWSTNGVAVTSIQRVTGAKNCPQGYFCLGGDPSTNTNIKLTETRILSSRAYGIPQQCPNNLTTEKEGAYSLGQCVAPPGKWGDLTTAVKDCPSGTYKETWARASSPADGCLPCGSGLWLSDKNYRVAYTDIYGQLLRQELVRGSSESCFIQRGMGTERSVTNSALNAIICPRNTYGIVGDPSLGRKYGLVHTPCTACPTSMITGYRSTSDVQVRRAVYHSNDSAGLTTQQLLSGAYLEPTSNVTVAVPTPSDTGSGTGFYHVRACTSRPGYGYDSNTSKKCDLGYYNAGGNDGPCQQCPPGTVTQQGSLAVSVDDCNILDKGYTLDSLTTKVPVQCPAGTYNPNYVLLSDITSQYVLNGVCTPCPTGTFSADSGMTAAGGCTLCAPGYGGSDVTACLNNAATTAICKNGWYGPPDRSTTPCVQCPVASRTFTFAYPSAADIDVFTPAVTSPPYAAGVEDCLADFAQIVDGPFYLDLKNDLTCNVPVADFLGNPILNLQTCVSECASRAGCAAATFDYYLASLGNTNSSCKLWMPSTGVNIAAGGVAMKTMPAAADAFALNVNKKDMGSGYFSLYMGSAAANCTADASLTTVAASTLQDCFDACSMVNECAGVKYAGINGTQITSCQLVSAVVQVGRSKRTLVKAIANSMVAGCAPGYRVNATDNTLCELCPANQYWGGSRNFGTSCNNCAAPGVASPDRTQCQVAATCRVGQQYNPDSPIDCIPCPPGTFKASNDSVGAPVACSSCPYNVSTDKTKCQQPAPCGRGLEWQRNEPGQCGVCERAGFYKDWADADETNVTRCIACPDVGPGKFQNSLALTRESCINNCDGGYFFDDSNMASRIDPTRCTSCPWPQVKSGPAPTACLEVCDVRNSDLTQRTTPNSDRTGCVKPVICGRDQEFDINFPHDISRCKPCAGGYYNDDGVWLCVARADGATVTCVTDGQEQDPNNLNQCVTCPFPRLTSCSAPCGPKVAWQGYCVTPITCTVGNYDPAAPLAFDRCS